MKKLGLILFGMLCATMSFAQSYGILVNGKTYFEGTKTGEPDYQGREQYLAHVQVSQGDYCQLYDRVNAAAWAVPLDEWTQAPFELSGDRYIVNGTGCYDFYIKLKYDDDLLYIGDGSGCGSGTDISGGGDDPTPPSPGYTSSVPSNCPDVLLQAFYWDSYNTKITEEYGRTKWVDFLNIEVDGGLKQGEEIGQWFDLVWLPPFSRSTGGTGYLPVCYSDLTSDWGQQSNLTKLIKMLHENGARVVADVVVNHVAAESGWCNFKTMNFGKYGKFIPDGSWICNTDEMNSDPKAGDCMGTATGAADDGYGSEANYDSGRDWDHNNQKVRDMCNAYAQWLRNVIKVDGFRYDYCKGFHNSHINEYNRSGQAYFSVMEMWDGSVDALQSHLSDAGWNTLTFDFATKYQAFNNGIASGNYQGLMGAGLPGAGKAKFAVTFLDSHDSFQRDDNEFCGLGNSMTVCKDKILQCYAYLLSMPGVPLVFYPHWVTFKEPIKKMINARYKTGVHSESAVSDEAGDGYYKATITGTNGQIRVLIGPNSGYNSTPGGFALAVKGENYGVYYKENTPRGDKNANRVPVGQGIEEVKSGKQETRGEKFIQNGQLFIRCGEQVYDVLGKPVK